MYESTFILNAKECERSLEDSSRRPCIHQLLLKVIYKSLNSEGKLMIPNLLRSDNLASEELRLGVGKVLDVVHDGLSSIAGSGLLEVLHAGPLDGGLDSEGRVVAELDDLWCVR